MSSTPRPPRWASRFLSWYCRPSLLEDLQGDLNEYFERNVATKGAGRARRIYVIDVLKFCRPYTIRKLKFINLFIQWIMIGSYIKTSGRNIVRNKLFSAINIVGLAISMSTGLLMICLLSDMFSYDHFHEKGSRIYRVISNFQYLNDVNNNYFASTSLRTAKAIEESVPGIENMAVLRRGTTADVKAGEKVIPLSGKYANASFFSVFTFPLLRGDPATALKNPYSVVLTESAAKKLFAGADAIGKSVTLFDNHEYSVTGIAKDVPQFSHLQFDMLISLSTREITEKDNKEDIKWDNMWSGYVYLLLPDNLNVQTLQANLDQMSKKENATVKNTKIQLSLQPLDRIALGPDLNNPIGPAMDKSMAWIIGILTLVVMVSACFNYTNLSIARAFRRSREVGIRKVIGASRGNVLGQFVMEAVIISLAALFFSFLLFLLMRPFFLSTFPKLQEMLKLDLSVIVIIYFILLAVGVGLISGILPALFFARINAVQVLKDLSTLKVFRNLNMRRVLVVIQYTISLIFISATIIGFTQYRYLLAFDLGFNTENILNITLHGNKADLIVKELSELPEVKGVSRSAMITSIGNYWATQMKYKNGDDSASVYHNMVDENYLPLHGHKLLAGRNFNPGAPGAQESEVIVNEKVLERFHIANQDPVKALDEIVTVDGKKLKIIGVMKDYHYGMADRKTDEVMFRYKPEEAEFLNVKVLSTDWPATFSKIEAAWKKIDNVHPLESKFYTDAIEQSYGEFSAMLKIIGFLAFLAICIASMGLFGMVVFTTETRLKEISIRKVLGASESNLVYLLSRGFFLLLFVAAVIALPATYLVFDRLVLVEIANHPPINIAGLILGVVGVLILAFIMIGSQTLKVAHSNPADVLKNE